MFTRRAKEVLGQAELPFSRHDGSNGKGMPESDIENGEKNRPQNIENGKNEHSKANCGDRINHRWHRRKHKQWYKLVGLCYTYLDGIVVLVSSLGSAVAF